MFIDARTGNVWIARPARIATCLAACLALGLGACSSSHSAGAAKPATSASNSTTTSAVTTTTQPPTPTSTGTTSTPATPAPTTTISDTALPAEPGCQPDGSESAVRPAAFVVACADGNARVAHASWSTWNTVQATGTGNLIQNDCDPSCAEGHFHTYAAVLTLYSPVTFRGQLVFSQLNIRFPGAVPPNQAKIATRTLVG